MTPRAAVTLVIVFLAFAFGCSSKKSSTVEQAQAPSTGLPQVVVDEPGLEGATVDSVYRQITPDVEATPIDGRQDEWMVIHTWMRARSMPENLFVMDDAERLEKEGKLADTSIVTFVYYRYPLKAKDLDAIRESVAVRTRRPDWPPAKLLAELKNPKS